MLRVAFDLGGTALRGSPPAVRSRRRSASSRWHRRAACPGISSSGCRTYGMMCSVGWRVQALRPASASEAPISFRKLRRPSTRSSSSLQPIACCGNSRSSRSRNSGVAARSSRLRQYSRPRAPSSRARTAARSNFLCWFAHRWQVSSWSACARPGCYIPHQPASDLFLVAGRLVAHGGDEFARSHILLGMAVAVETPLHLQRVLLPGERHPVHPPVAALTTDSLIDVNAVIEIDKVGQIVHPRPLIDWPVRKLARTGSSVGLVLQICEWQFMHVLVGGILAKLEVSTVVWQYRQSRPRPPT